MCGILYPSRHAIRIAEQVIHNINKVTALREQTAAILILFTAPIRLFVISLIAIPKAIDNDLINFTQFILIKQFVLRLVLADCSGFALRRTVFCPIFWRHPS